ncbi:DsbA family oxidoreductase [Chitinibacteraceae bacterium HSL-7]
MTAPLRIDFVSDVVCPWCAIGLYSLIQGAKDAGIELEIVFQPFELNPGMGPAGEDIRQHLARKYGMSDAQLDESQEAIRQRGAELGFVFDMQARTHTYNTFDAHRLLAWALSSGHQLALKQALLSAYFGQGRNVSDPATLLEIASEVGLDAAAAADVLAGDAHADDVRDAQRFYQSQGVSAVPAVVVDRRYLISGGQPPEVFARALAQIAAERKTGQGAA